MSLITYKLLAAFFILVTTIIAVAYPIKVRFKVHQHGFMDLGDAFASGVFLGVALFHMIPDATEGFQQIYPNFHYPLAELFCAFGFILLLLLERLSHNSRFNHQMTIPYLIASTLMIHSLIEGMALGVNTELATATIIFIAIMVHKGSESFALSLTLCRGNHLPTTQLYWLVGIFAIMTPLGIILGLTLASFMQFKEAQLITAAFNAFAAGTFLYMSTLHHIHHHQRLHEAEGIAEFFCLVAGLGLMALVVLWT